jgi:hypothetical protein
MQIAKLEDTTTRGFTLVLQPNKQKYQTGNNSPIAILELTLAMQRLCRLL